MMTQAPVTTDPATLAASVVQWWALAGVDVAVEDIPRNWLARPRPAPVPSMPPPQMVQPVGVDDARGPDPVPRPEPQSEPEQHIATPMPDRLDAFLQWLANDPGQPEATFARTRILPDMVETPDLLIVTDMPSQDDMNAGRLFSGAEASLLSGMMRALGMDTPKAAHASLLLARPAGGIIDDRIVQQAARRLVHFTRLAAPKAIILLGDKTNRAFQQMNGISDNLSTYAVNLGDGMVTVAALPAPFVLLKHPERKAAAWAQLRHMAKR